MTIQHEDKDKFPVLLTLEQAAERMNSSPRLARRLVDERRIPVYKVGRFVRIAESDLLEFIQNGSRSARA